MQLGDNQFLLINFRLMWNVQAVSTKRDRNQDFLSCALKLVPSYGLTPRIWSPLLMWWHRHGKQPEEWPQLKNPIAGNLGCRVRLHPELHSHGRYTRSTGPHAGQGLLPLGCYTEGDSEKEKKKKREKADSVERKDLNFSPDGGGWLDQARTDIQLGRKLQLSWVFPYCQLLLALNSGWMLVLVAVYSGSLDISLLSVGCHLQSHMPTR